jgi:phage shock protein PspC (stress-responsive transcriptional regulator)
VTTTPTPLPALDRFFTWLRRSPVSRSPQRAIAGVCSGVAERLGMSTVVVRVATVVLAILGPAVAIYFLAWLLLPDSRGRIRLERALRGGDTSSIVLLVATFVVILPDAGGHARIGWLSLVLVVAVAWVFHQGGLRGPRHGMTSTGSTPAPSGPNNAPKDAPSV